MIVEKGLAEEGKGEGDARKGSGLGSKEGEGGRSGCVWGGKGGGVWVLLVGGGGRGES